jgi:hypothetical protein
LRGSGESGGGTERQDGSSYEELRHRPPLSGPVFTGFLEQNHAGIAPMTGQFAPRLPQYRHFGKTALGYRGPAVARICDTGQPRPASGFGAEPPNSARPNKPIFRPEPNETKPRPDR